MSTFCDYMRVKQKNQAKVRVSRTKVDQILAEANQHFQEYLCSNTVQNLVIIEAVAIL